MNRAYFVILNNSDINSNECQIIIKLNEKIPKTCTRFLELCTSPKNSYKLSKISRVISPEFIIQGGHIENENIFFGDEYSADTNSNYDLDDKGLVFVATKNKQLPSSEFFISMNNLGIYVKEIGLNDYVILGKVIKGFKALVMLMNNVSVDGNLSVVDDVIISRSGELKLKNKGKEGTVLSEQKERAPGFRGRDISDRGPHEISTDERSGRHHSHREHPHHHQARHSAHTLHNTRDRSSDKYSPRSGSGYGEPSRKRSHIERREHESDSKPDSSSEFYKKYDSLLTASLYYKGSPIHRKEWVDRDPKRLQKLPSDDDLEEAVEKKGRGFSYK